MSEIIAITGGIGSGKSQVLSILEGAGEKVISCDKITNDLYENQTVKLKLASIFPECDNEKTGVTKQAVAKIVFNDKAKLKTLTDFLTPLILEESLSKAKALGGRVFVEVPLLFECNAQNKFDKVLVVLRDKTQRVKSVIKRSNLSEQEVLKRIDSQFDYDSADLTPFVVIVNDGDLQTLKQKVLNLI